MYISHQQIFVFVLWSGHGLARKVFSIHIRSPNCLHNFPNKEFSIVYLQFVGNKNKPMWEIPLIHAGQQFENREWIDMER